MKKKYSFLLLTALVTLTQAITPLMATNTASPAPSASPATTQPMPKKHPDRKGGHFKTAKPPVPYKGFTTALENIKDNGKITAEQVKHVYKVLMKIPASEIDKASNKDKFIADTLLKEEALTQEQYDLIMAVLNKSH